MDFREFAEHFRHQQLITTQSIRNAFDSYSPVQLSRWKDRGWIVQIRRGQFILAAQIDSVDRELLANEMKNSYISLEYALNYHNLIPEVPQKITAVTTERGEKIKTPVGSFVYQKIKPPLFGSYELKQSKLKKRLIKIASPTKALFDFIYLNSQFKSQTAFFEARFNLDEVVKLFDPPTFSHWLRRVRQPTRIKRLQNFLDFVNHHDAKLRTN